MGADPTSSGWKPDILADKLYLHITGIGLLRKTVSLV